MRTKQKKKHFRKMLLATVMSLACVSAVIPYQGPAVSAQTTQTAEVSLARYSMEGYATVQGVTGGGTLSETSSNYYKVSNAEQFLSALSTAKKSKQATVIELTDDIALGSKEIGSALSTYSNVISAHSNQPLLHPTLLETGVSMINIKDMSNLTIFSQNASKITHACFNISKASNIMFRNIVFDELWEWDENTSGDYDRNDWDYITIQNSSTGIWIDHCTFYKAYDGIIDVKKASSSQTTDVTISYSQFLPASEGSFFDEMMSLLESNPSKYSYYNSLLTKYSMTAEQVRGYAYGQKKVHLIGASDSEANTENLRITLANNYYKDCMDRLPRIRSGYAHVYNCIMDSSDLYAIRNTITNSTARSKIVSNGSVSTVGAKVLLENTSISGIINALLSGNGNSSAGYIGAVNTIYTLDGVEQDLTVTSKTSTQLTLNAEEFLSELPYSNVQLYEVDTLYDTVLPYSGAAALVLSAEQWMQTVYEDTEVTPEETPEVTPEAISYNHDFTTCKLVSDFYQITGSLSSSKGTVTYNGTSYKSALKMESATKISFAAEESCTLTLVANAGCNKVIEINNVEYSFTDGLLIVELGAGDYEITKGDSNVNVYYMETSI